MRITRLGLAATITCAALIGCAHQGGAGGANSDEGDDEQELDVRDVAAEAKVSLVDAVRAAHAARPGKIVEAELEGEVEGGIRAVFYEMTIVDDGKAFEVKVDAATGKVTSVEVEDDAEEAAEMLALAASMPPHTRGLGDFLKIAEGRAPSARAVKAEFAVEHGRAIYEVELLRGRDLLETDVDVLHPDMKADVKEPEDEKDEGDEEDEGAEDDEK